MGIPDVRRHSCLVRSEQRKGSLGNLLRCVHPCFSPDVGHKNINRKSHELTGGFVGVLDLVVGGA